jgi:hypothetical protein
MVTRKFKIFETINNFRKLYEADEMNQDAAAAPAEGDMTNPEQPADATNPPGVEDQNNANPNLENGEKAQWAEIMLKALRMEPSKIGEIPSEFENINNENAEKVKKHIEAIVGLSAPLELDNELNDESMAAGLNSLS